MAELEAGSLEVWEKRNYAAEFLDERLRRFIMRTNTFVFHFVLPLPVKGGLRSQLSFRIFFDAFSRAGNHFVASFLQFIVGYPEEVPSRFNNLEHRTMNLACDPAPPAQEGSIVL